LASFTMKRMKRLRPSFRKANAAPDLASRMSVKGVQSSDRPSMLTAGEAARLP
jgi:hypothetical protein